MNKKTFTRRSFTTLGSVAALGLISNANAKDDTDLSSDDIVYKTAIPSNAADYAYELYSDGGCMYATVKSVLSMTIAKSVPMHYEMFRYGHGGCGGQGSLCGACNGVAAAISFHIKDKKECDALVAEVFRWYEMTNLPTYKPEDSDNDIVTSASGSTLCHVSMTKWCKAAGKDPFSDERKNRCARLTADTVGKTVELLNEYFSDSQKSVKEASPKPSCAPCHMKDIKTGKLSKSPKVKVKMDCTVCHAYPHPDMK